MTRYTASTGSYADLTPNYNNPDDQFILAISDDGGQTWSRENAWIWNNETSDDPTAEGYIYGKGDYVLNELPVMTYSPIFFDLDRKSVV